MIIKYLEDIEHHIKKDCHKVIGVASAEDPDIVGIIKELETKEMVHFALVGDQEKIEKLLHEKQVFKDKVQIFHCPEHGAAARKVVELVKSGQCDLLMKGNLHTSVFLKAILDKEKGLNTGHLLSQISIYNRPLGEGIQAMTDCAMAITPNLEEKKQLIENAVELMRKLGYECPKVAVLSALEVVNPKIEDTLDAAVLSKMCERGQIKHCIVDGPLAFDNAVSMEAAVHKGIKSPVAGNADILLFPNLQTGNCVLKSMIFYAKMDVAAVIMGSQVPVVMTSRSDTVKNKILSILTAIYLAENKGN